MFLVTDSVNSNPDGSLESLRQQQEEAFAIHSQERIMGLLGAMIPVENKVGLSKSHIPFHTNIARHFQNLFGPRWMHKSNYKKRCTVDERNAETDNRLEHFAVVAITTDCS